MRSGAVQGSGGDAMRRATARAHTHGCVTLLSRGSRRSEAQRSSAHGCPREAGPKGRRGLVSREKAGRAGRTAEPREGRGRMSQPGEKKRIKNDFQLRPDFWDFVFMSFLNSNFDSNS